MYLIKDWCFVNCILDPNTANIYKGYAFKMPKFDEMSFPFVVICGWQHISLLNIVTLEHKPLINGNMRSDKAGLQFVFAKGNSTEIEFHFSFKVRDKDGSGKTLIQYSYVSLRSDINRWLMENGRLPSFTTEEYFDCLIS